MFLASVEGASQFDRSFVSSSDSTESRVNINGMQCMESAAMQQGEDGEFVEPEVEDLGRRAICRPVRRWVDVQDQGAM